MKDFYFPISLPFSINIDSEKFIGQQTRCDSSILSKDMCQWIESNLNAVILWTEVFYLKPYQFYDIHCDGHEVDNKCKLNYIINGEDSIMYWYRAVDHNKIVGAYSKSKTRYLKLEKNNAEEISRAILNNFNLVNVGDFHTVVNGKRNRWCISIVVGDKISKERLDFDEVRTRLNKI